MHGERRWGMGGLRNADLDGPALLCVALTCILFPCMSSIIPAPARLYVLNTVVDRL